MDPDNAGGGAAMVVGGAGGGAAAMPFVAGAGVVIPIVAGPPMGAGIALVGPLVGPLGGIGLLGVAGGFGFGGPVFPPAAPVLIGAETAEEV